MINTPHNGELIMTICGILRSEPFRKELASIRGYDLSRTGEVIYEC
jgi:putative molybdopterin biosynthesis protein